MRLIDADALKSTIKHRCVLSALDAQWPLAYGRTDINDLIDSMPTIEAEPNYGKWIPVTKQLPQLDKTVLIQFKSGLNDYAIAKLDNIYYGNDTFYWETEEEEKSIFYLNDIISWMPLPEPYREVEE